MIPVDNPNAAQNHPIGNKLHKFTRLDPEDERYVVYLPVIGKVNHDCSPNAMLVFEHDAEGNERPVARTSQPIRTIPRVVRARLAWCLA
jgi:hypothetical protein